MRIVTLNVNGLRAFDEKNGNNFNNYCLNVLEGDIVCLQETKGSEGSLAKYHSLKDYSTFSSFHDKKGRHGVSTLVKKSLFCEKTQEIVPGRILKTYHGNFVLYNCYLPYYDEKLEGDKSEIIKVYETLKESISDNRTIIAGDLNSTYNIIDHYQYYHELQTLMTAKEWMPHEEIEKSKFLLTYKKMSKKTLKSILEHSNSCTSPNNIETGHRSTKINKKEESECNVIEKSKIQDIKRGKEYLNTGATLSNIENSTYTQLSQQNSKADQSNIEEPFYIDEKIQMKIQLFLRLKESEEEYLDDCLRNDYVKKINPPETQLPFHFFSFKSLEEYFFQVYQRKWLADLILIYNDTFRLFNKKLTQFTCWNTKLFLRIKNWGTRIDYILCSKDMECSASDIMPEIQGSDHCPVYTIFHIEPFVDDSKNLVKKKNNLLDFFSKK